MNNLWQDLRYGVRMMLKSRAVTAVAVLSLALGIGANTALFSLVDAVLLKTLPVKEPEQLVLFRWLSGPELMSHMVSGEIDVVPGTGLQNWSRAPRSSMTNVKSTMNNALRL
jgi:hypothetical protein